MNQHQPTDDEPVIQTVAEPLQQYLKNEAAGHRETKPVGSSSSTQPPTRVFRPTHRQPLAALTILDDGERDAGEVIRIRNTKYKIGREKGDVTIPFDSDMSSCHAELRCQKQKGRYRWFLIDRKSTNGTFVRAYRASLSSESELILGSRRYQFRMPRADAEAGETEALQTQRYRAPSQTMLEQFVPQLRELGSDDERSFSLAGSELFVGCDPQSEILIPDDPFLSATHARVYQDETERWMIEDRKSLNGVWIRVKRFALDKSTEFQLGQQRFRFQPAFP